MVVGSQMLNVICEVPTDPKKDILMLDDWGSESFDKNMRRICTGTADILAWKCILVRDTTFCSSTCSYIYVYTCTPHVHCPFGSINEATYSPGPFSTLRSTCNFKVLLVLG